MDFITGKYYRYCYAKESYFYFKFDYIYLNEVYSTGYYNAPMFGTDSHNECVEVGIEDILEYLPIDSPDKTNYYRKRKIELLLNGNK